MRIFRLAAVIALLWVAIPAVAAWQLSSPETRVQVEFGTPVTAEFSIQNTGTDASPATEMLANLGLIAFRVEYSATALSAECGDWRITASSVDLINFRELRFSIPAIPVGGSIRCRYRIEQLFTNASKLDIYLRANEQSSAAPIRLTIGALVDLTVDAQLLSSTNEGTRTINRYRIRFNNDSPHIVSRYGIGYCFQPGANFGVSVNLPGGCANDAPGLTCFGGGGSGLSAGAIPAGQSASCEILTSSIGAPNIGIYQYSELRRADGRALFDTNINNDSLRIRAAEPPIQVPALHNFSLLILALTMLGLGRYAANSGRFA